MLLHVPGGTRRGSETQASDGPTSKPATGGGGEESHKEVRKPVGDGNALDAGDAGHGKASAAGDVENTEVVFELGVSVGGTWWARNSGAVRMGAYFQ